MSKYDKSTAELIKDYFKSIDLQGEKTFKRQELYDWFNKNYPKIKRGNLYMHLTKLTVNAPSRKYCNPRTDGSDDILFQTDAGIFKKYKLKDKIEPKPPEPSIIKPRLRLYEDEEKKKMNLIKTHEILFSKRDEMNEFMNFYIFEKINIKMDKFVDDKDQFIRFIDSCLNARKKIVNSDLRDGIEYFKGKYLEIKKYINENNIEKLRKIIYSSPGVGQKIGSMILEFIYLYSKYKNDDIIKILYLPIDTHVERIFYDSFGIIIPKNISNHENKIFTDFQLSLDEYSNNKGRIYFDFFWFIGKMFCAKITNEKSKGYRLCKYCWIKEYCDNEKWL